MLFYGGARQTGKSTYLAHHFSDSYLISLLKSDEYLRYSKSPHEFRQHILALSDDIKRCPIIVDEIQKVPALLDEVHYLIETEKLSFILCGSSARKLKRTGVNLLGGRAWRFNFFPLTSREVPELDLLQALNKGLLPSHYDNPHIDRALRAYVQDYLTEEVHAESLVRNLPAFARFLDGMALGHGQITNYSNIAQDIGVDIKTVKEYFQILVDTLLAYRITPYSKKIRRAVLTKAPKYYLFDVGVAQYLQHVQVQGLAGQAAGQAFEHFILMEIIAYRGLMEKDFTVNYWRTNHGLEVDFILASGTVAIEVKLTEQVQQNQLSGLMAFQEEHQPQHALVVSRDPRARYLSGKSGDILILPWQQFLDRLWQGQWL